MTGPTDAAKPWLDAWTGSMAPFMQAMLARSPDAATTPVAQSGFEDHFKALNATWKESIEKWTSLARDGNDPAAMTPDDLRAIFTPDHWSGPGAGVFDSGLREILEGPKYATLGNMDREALELQRRAAERDRQALAFQAIVQKAWNTAFERFARSFASQKSETPGTWRGLTDRWLAIANETLIEAHRTDEFVKAQTGMLRAASEYRLQEREIAEAWCTAFHIPTRTEMDEMQRVVTELRRELRLQRRQAASPGTVQRTGALAATPRRAAAKKPRRAAAKR